MIVSLKFKSSHVYLPTCTYLHLRIYLNRGKAGVVVSVPKKNIKYLSCRSSQLWNEILPSRDLLLESRRMAAIVCAIILAHLSRYRCDRIGLFFFKARILTMAAAISNGNYPPGDGTLGKTAAGVATDGP